MRNGCSASLVWPAARQLSSEGRDCGVAAYLRQRERLLDTAASHIQHMQKA